jgi:hypothetical protein
MALLIQNMFGVTAMDKCQHDDYRQDYARRFIRNAASGAA